MQGPLVVACSCCGGCGFKGAAGGGDAQQPAVEGGRWRWKVEGGRWKVEGEG
jgi:hypothetical protein